jgi:hypothetical protein
MANLPKPIALPADLRRHGDDLSLSELWLRCFALGAMNTQADLGAFLAGNQDPTPHEYNVVVVAMNEYLGDIGVAQFFPYVEPSELGEC